MRSQKGNAATRLRRAVYFILILFALSFAFNLIPYYLYYNPAIDQNSLIFASSAVTSFAFGVSAIAYLLLVEKSKRSVAERLGLARNSFSVRNLLLGALIFMILFVMELALGLISSVTGIQINTNVGLLFAGAPLWFYVFAAVISPINEELLFRGLLVPRVGVVLSSFVFAVLHSTYSSTYQIEVVAALIFGLIAGYVYKRTGSLYPSIAAHMLVNAFTLVSILSIAV